MDEKSNKKEVVKPTVKDHELDLVQPRGRNGRRSTNFLVAFASKGEGGSIEELLELTVNEEFLEVHLKSFLSEDDAKFVDDNATTGELLNLIMAVISEVFEGFSAPEVKTALKNSPEAQKEEG